MGTAQPTATTQLLGMILACIPSFPLHSSLASSLALCRDCALPTNPTPLVERFGDDRSSLYMAIASVSSYLHVCILGFLIEIKIINDWLSRKAKCGWGFGRLVRTCNILISFNFYANFTEELRRKLIVMQVLLREKINGCEGIEWKAGLRLRMKLVRILNQNVSY